MSFARITHVFNRLANENFAKKKKKKEAKKQLCDSVNAWQNKKLYPNNQPLSKNICLLS